MRLEHTVQILEKLWRTERMYEDLKGERRGRAEILQLGDREAGDI